jgi:hypothetical protein
VTQPATSHRILVDLSHAADGYVGIAQDTSLIFDMLADQPGERRRAADAHRPA